MRCGCSAPPIRSPSDYRALQPFGQVPVLEDGDLKLFESGAIVMHIAERSDALLPVGCRCARPREDLDVRGAELDRAAHPESRRDRSVLRRQGMDQGPPADRGRDGAQAARRTVGVARRARLSGGPLHRRRSADDHGAAHPAPYRSARRAARAGRVSRALRSAAGVCRALAAQMEPFAKNAPA